MPVHKRTGWLKWLVALILVGGAIAGGIAYSKRAKNDVPELRTSKITQGDITQMVTANGQLTPVVNVEVGSQVSGTIEQILADFNSRVTNGQIIAQIESSTFKASVDQAEAELANARASLELAQVEARRAENLFKGNLISQSDNDKAIAEMRQAQAVVKIREASLKRTMTDFERTTIYAPIDGVVISRSVEVGQTVAASFNTPKLFQIANDLSKMEIEAMVSEADVGGVEEGQKVLFTVDAFPTRQFQGVVKQVRYAPTTNQNVVTYTTVVAVNNADLKLRPGMTANASMIVAERRNVLRIPNAALRFRPPEGVTVTGQTNRALASRDSTNRTASAVATSGPFAGLPVPPWQGEARRPTPEEREKYEASLIPEQRELYRQARERMRARFAEGGGGSGGFGGSSTDGFGGSTSGPRVSYEGPTTQTVYVMTSPGGGGAKPTLKAVTITTGITDGTNTEVISGLSEGDAIVAGVVRQEPSLPGGRPGGTSPFGGPFGPRRF